MSDPCYITIDLETGGIETECSLLTAFFGVLDKDMNLLDKLNLNVRPNNDMYVLTVQGMEVNKINFVTHNKIAVSESEAGAQLHSFLRKNTNDGKIKLIPVGHNVNFDMSFIYAHLLTKKNIDKFVSYRQLDTSAVAQWLKYKGVIPDNKSGSLSSLSELFGIDFRNNAHEAESDAMMCVDILKKMKEKDV